MERIDIHNYEAYLLDFSEGSLQDELQVELELFLIQHPELSVNLAELSAGSMEKDAIHYSEKNNLKKSEFDLVSETQFIAYIERQLTSQEYLHVEKSCEINPLLLKELGLYKATIATVDTSVMYSDKKELKRKPKVVWFDFSITTYASAACILFLIGLLIFWPGSDAENNNRQLANKSKINYRLKTTTVNSYSQKESHLATKTVTQKTFPSMINKPIVNKKSIPQQKENTPLKDTASHHAPIPETPIELKTNEPLITLNTLSNTKHSSNTIVQVISENDENVTELKKETRKIGLWAVASRALKNLNHAGVKSVNGDESSTKEKTGYALTLGGLNITHTPANL
jgi:hypothetical protein